MDTLKKKMEINTKSLLLHIKYKEILTNYAKLWDRIKSLIKTISDKLGEYEKYLIKIKFNLDGNLLLNKILKLHVLTIVVRSDFQEDKNYYPQVFLDESLYEL